MKSLNYLELKELSDSLNVKLKGNHISNITVVSSTDILLTFSFYRKEKLLISLNHSSPFLSLIDASFNINTLMGNLSEELRKTIKDTVLEEIVTIDKERIIKIKCVKTDEFYSKSSLFLILELIPTHPNLIITDENNKVLFATHYTSLTADRIILKGMNYDLPKASVNLKEENLKVDLDKFKVDVNSYLGFLIDKRLKEKYSSLIQNLKWRIKKAKNKIKILKEEIEEAKSSLVYKEYGEMIFALLYDENELKEYLNINNIAIDENKTYQENANIFFKKYKKAKATISYNEEELEKNDLLIKELENDLASLDGDDESIYMILNDKYLKVRAPKQEINKLMPYYVTIDNTKIGFGRNANQNNVLTFKYAKEDYYFIHVKDTHSHHVVILKSNPSDNDKENASMLALFLLNKEAGTVNIAQIKDVKKGHSPGLVLLNKYSEIKINNISNKVKNALNKTKRITF